jgi:hypothetical protein
VVVEMVVVVLLLVLEIHAGSTPRRDRSLSCVRCARGGWGGRRRVALVFVAAWPRGNGIYKDSE